MGTTRRAPLDPSIFQMCPASPTSIIAEDPTANRGRGPRFESTGAIDRTSSGWRPIVTKTRSSL
jgi:hypothetical protein